MSNDFTTIPQGMTWGDLVTESKNTPIVIFKHSSACGTSFQAKAELDEHWNDSLKDIKIYILVLQENRALSNEIAEKGSVRHQSPQILLFHKGSCVYHTSHLSINSGKLADEVSKIQ